MSEPDWQPSMEWIERAWRPARTPSSPEYKGYVRFIRWSTRLPAFAIFAVAAGFAAATTADRLFELGWGFEWSDLWFAVGFAAFNAVLLFLCEAMSAFLDR